MIRGCVTMVGVGLLAIWLGPAQAMAGFDVNRAKAVKSERCAAAGGCNAPVPGQATLPSGPGSTGRVTMPVAPVIRMESMVGGGGSPLLG